MTTLVPRKRPTPHFDAAQGPIVTGGVGGSGTRAVVEVMRRLNIYTGTELNKAGDNLWFSLLCKLPRWNVHETSSIMRSFELLEQAMQGMLAPTRKDRKVIAEIVDRCTAWTRQGDLSDDRSEAWLQKVSASLLQSKPVPEGARGWGWKEPNSHLFLAHLQTHFGDRLRYVHVIRNGVYMAYSANQSQVRRWGTQFDIEADIDPPVASLDYWIRSNELAIDRGRAMKPGSFFLVNHDHLCESPREEVTRLVDFLGIRTSQEELEELIALPQPPKPVGISHQRMITEFGEERLARVRALGFALGDEASPLGS
jgi:Sulfotransferase family